MMVIIQHQNELLLYLFQNFVEENVYRALGVLREFTRCFLQIGKHGLAKARYKLLDTEGQVSKKNGRVRVRVIQLVPDKLAFVSAQKIRHQGGFSRSGIGGYQRQRKAEICEETVS